MVPEFIGIFQVSRLEHTLMLKLTSAGTDVAEETEVERRKGPHAEVCAFPILGR